MTTDWRQQKRKKMRGKPVQKRRVKVALKRGYKKNNTLTTGLKWRALFVLVLLCSGFTAVAGQLAWIGFVPQSQSDAAAYSPTAEGKPRRGSIVDREGRLLAMTLDVPSLYADPKRVLSPQETAQKLVGALDLDNEEALAKALSSSSRRFVWIKRQLSPAEAKRVHHLGLPGVHFRTEQVRVYPQRNLASHVLGGLDIDGYGIAGVEAGMNETLRQGDTVELTLESRLQQQLRQTLRKHKDESEAKAAWGVSMDVRTGDILAMVSLPDYDANHLGQATDSQRFNHNTLGVYEMGSTFKLLTLAQGLEEGHITMHSELDCSEPLKIGKFTIHDYYAEERVLTAMEVLRHSSNIGAAQIADMYGPAAQEAFFRKFGLLRQPQMAVPELGQPKYPRRWGRVHTMTAAFGHGVAVTPLQLVAAAGALTDGVYRSPRLVLNKDADTPQKVLSAATVQKMRQLMFDIMFKGSGRHGQIGELYMGGKTGTAEKIGAQGYNEQRNRVSFLGVAPLDDPKLVTLLMFDEPKQGFHTGGRLASPAFGTFMKGAAPLLGLVPDPKKVAQAKHNYVVWEAEQAAQSAAQDSREGRHNGAEALHTFTAGAASGGG